MKPLFIKIAILVSLVVLLGIGVYVVWTRALGTEEVSSPQSPPATGGETVPNLEADVELPDTASSSSILPKKVSDGEAFRYWIVSDTGEAYYLTPEGRVFLISDDEPDEEVLSQSISDLQTADESPSGRLLLVSFGDRAELQWGAFDTIDGVWRPLPQEVRYATWGGRDELLYGIVDEKGVQTLSEIRLAFGSPSIKPLMRNFRLLNTHFRFLSSPDRLFLTELPSESYEGRAWELDLKTLLFRPFFAPEKGLSLHWSPDGKILFRFSTNGGFDALNPQKESVLPLSISTFPEKCTSNDGEIFCFVPQDFFESTHLPDDYYKKALMTIDDLYSLDTNTFFFQKIFSSYGAEIPGIDGIYPRYSNGELYFLNRYDGGVYKVNL